MTTLFTFIVTLFKSWLGFKQDAAIKQGTVLEDNKVLNADLKAKDAELKAIQNEQSLEDSLKSGNF